MAVGPGKYDDLCTYVRTTAKADGAVIMVIRGERGNGFSVQASLELIRELPAALRNMADEIERGI